MDFYWNSEQIKIYLSVALKNDIKWPCRKEIIEHFSSLSVWTKSVLEKEKIFFAIRTHDRVPFSRSPTERVRNTFEPNEMFKDDLVGFRAHFSANHIVTVVPQQQHAKILITVIWYFYFMDAYDLFLFVSLFLTQLCTLCLYFSVSISVGFCIWLMPNGDRNVGGFDLLNDLFGGTVYNSIATSW